MMDWIKGFIKGLIEEVFMKSKTSDDSDVDTFFRWFIATIFIVGFYLLIYNMHYETPVPAKIAWHRLAAGTLASVGLFCVTALYLRHLYNRIKARIATSNAKSLQADGKDQAEDEAKS